MLTKKCSPLFAFLFIVIVVFLFHSKALNFGFAYQELQYVVNARAADLPDVLNHLVGSAKGAEFRPLNHYLFFLINKAIFGNNPQAFRLVWLLLHCFNGLLIYLLISKITKNKRIAFFTIFVFFTRAALLTSFYAIAYSPPKLLFFLLLTFIFYLKQRENKALFLPLSIAAYVLAMFTRETFVFLPIALAAYEIIFNFDCKITLNHLKIILKKITPHLAVILSYILIRTPFFLSNISLADGAKSQPLQISYKGLSLKNFLANLINLIRFNYNVLTLPLQKMRLGNAWLGLLDVAFYLTLLLGLHFIYSIIFKRRPPLIFSQFKKNILWGGAWFFSFIILYCFFGNMQLGYLYTGSLGFCLIVACLGEYYYNLLMSKKPWLCYGITAFLLIHTLGSFYFLSQKRVQNDKYLRGWEIAASYTAGAKKLYPSIPPGASIHLYGSGSRKSLIWKGYLFKYLYKNKDLNVVYHDLQLKRTKIKPGDIVFRLEKDELIGATPKL